MTMPPVIDKSIIKDNARKIAGLKDAPELILFLEVAEVNRNIKALLDILEGSSHEDGEKAMEKSGEIGNGLERILSILPWTKKNDQADASKLISEQVTALRTQVVPALGLSDIPKIANVLEDIRHATQVASGNIPKDYEEAFDELRRAVLEKGEDTTELLKEILGAIPSETKLDYEKLSQIIKDNLKITIFGGSGGWKPYIRNVAGTVINPSTEEKQDAIISAIGAIPSGGGTQYTEGDTDASITGTAMLIEGAADTLATVKADAAGNAKVALYDATGADLDFRMENENWNAADHGILVFGRDTASTPDKYRALNLNSEGDLHVDLSDINGVEPSVGAGNADTGTLRVVVATNQSAIPVSATDLDIRNLSSAQDSVTTVPSGTQDANVLALPTDARSATAVDATASGDSTIVSITNSPRLYYICLSANGANTADVTVIVRIGASAKYKVSLKAGAIWARNIGAGRSYITGSSGDDIIVNLSAAQTVHVSVEYADI